MIHVLEIQVHFKRQKNTNCINLLFHDFTNLMRVAYKDSFDDVS